MFRASVLGPRVFLGGVLVTLFAFVAGESKSGQVMWGATLAVEVRDGKTGRPVDCVDAILLDTRYGAHGDSTGIARVQCLQSRDFRLRVLRHGYRDTVLVVRMGGGFFQSIRVELARMGEQIPPCARVPGCDEPEAVYVPTLLDTVADTVAATPRDIEAIVKPVKRNPKQRK